MTTPPPLRTFASAVPLLLLAAWSVTARGADASAPAVPLIACRTDGQMGPANPQALAALPGLLDERLVAQISFYSAAHAPGVYAPRGWYCVAWEGLNGSMLLVTPRRVPPPYFPLPMITGPAVMLQSSDAASSGRFRVAVIAAQVFPVVGADFIDRIRQEHVIADSSFDAAPYPDDQLQYLSDRLVEFTTPANRSGLGTDGMLEVSDLPVRGMMILNLPDEVNTLTEVRLRLPANLNPLAATIMQLETTCLQLRGRCRGF